MAAFSKMAAIIHKWWPHDKAKILFMLQIGIVYFYKAGVLIAVISSTSKMAA